MHNIVEIYTDGSTLRNPGPGGYAAILCYKGFEREISGCEAQTTNNRMELLAAITAIEALKRTCAVKIYTDSQYVQKGASLYLPNWKANNWRNSSDGSLKNVDLWQRLDVAMRTHAVTWIWIRGHNGHAYNERVDKLARRAAERASREAKPVA